MAIYIDSADRDLIGDLWATGMFAGVTTNPTILERSGLAQRDLPALYHWLTDLGVGRVYAQVLGRTAAELRRSAAELRALGPVVVKVPATRVGLGVAAALVADGAEVLLTAVYHPVQALLARESGLQGIAPYVGRMTDAGRDGMQGVVRMQRIVDGSATRVLAASLRSADDVAALAAEGVQDFTVGAAVAREMLDDPLTEAAAEAFEASAA
jgi:transaldolase